MLDADLAPLYGVPTRALIQAVRRNPERFPADFMFRLATVEAAALRSQTVISNVGRGGRRYLPYAFTEQGVAVLSSVLLEARRAYVTVITERRLHQQGFRERVLRAYQEQCAICRLRHDELLEAAHILPDGHPKGEPIVPNGLALCALHHAAFDGNILGIRPDFVVEVRLDILREKDGPMLQHGLQGFQGLSILKPRSRELWPRADFLAERYEEFRRAS
jgi:hypothetical protein